jgi:hypothetical protein
MNYFDDEQIKKGRKLVFSIIIIVLAVEVYQFHTLHSDQWV